MSYEQFNSLKELDIVKHVLDFKFNPNTIMTVLNDHLHKNGTWNFTLYHLLHDVFVKSLENIKYHYNIL